jgi:protoporphyrinogen oxidase/nucleoside-diphosphate-sugar epimerase
LPYIKNILVTGGAGFIGSHLCDRLLSDGCTVVCLDNFITGDKTNLQQAMQNPRFSIVDQNVQDSLPNDQFDQIYNLACPASPPKYQHDPVETMRTCIIGALNVLEYGRKHGARVLQASTSEVYGDPDRSPQCEEYVGAVNCTGRRACYDEGKRAAEALFFDFHRQYDVKIRVARIFNTYGPRMSPDDGRVIPNFITQALYGDPITIYGDGSQTRSFCYVDDLIDGLVRLMNEPGGRHGPVNLGNPNEFTVRELANLVVEQTKSTSKIKFLPLPEDDPKIRRPDIQKISGLIGWEPKVLLPEGLQRSITWRLATPQQRAANVAYLSDHKNDPAKKPRRDNVVADIVRSPRRFGMNVKNVAIIGGGPAGLTAAYELQKHTTDHVPIVLEADDLVGGISRTESHNGFRFDIGGHRFFTKVKEVEQLWHEVLGTDFIKRPRKSRIFYQGQFYDYPLKIFNALGNMGPYEAVRIGLSYLKWQVFPSKVEKNLEQWVTNRFGGRLFLHFFKTYTEKVWGIPCTQIQADWAAQRIKNLSLTTAVWNALTGANDTASLIEEFQYPRLGPGMMWEKFRDKIRTNGGAVKMNSRVSRVFRDGHKITEIEVFKDSNGEKETYRLQADEFISTMPLKELVGCIEPAPPQEVMDAADKLKYRDFLIVTLVLADPDPFDDNWIYIHSPDVKVGRIQNFRAWSPEMVPDADKASIGMEYFCHEGDGLWKLTDKELIKLATKELAALNLAKAETVIDGAVIRQKKAYPVYDGEYRAALDVIQEWILSLENFQTVGRNGMHRYNNQDHSMLTAMLAVRNILGEDHDIWNVNVERSYHEEFSVQKEAIEAA